MELAFFNKNYHLTKDSIVYDKEAFNERVMLGECKCNGE